MSSFSTLPKLPYNVSDEVMQAAAKIRLALFDVDGVLTDGSLYYGENGEEIKTFNVLDGHGLKMLAHAGITVAIISARKSLALQHRMNDLGIEHSHLGVSDKRRVFESLLAELKYDKTQCCFTGDDVIDLPVMSECGLKFSVANGHFMVRHAADWVSPFAGGQGAVRSICDILLYSRKTYPLGSTNQQ